MLFDRQGHCLRANRTGLDLMQLSEQDVKGKALRELWPEDVRAAVDQAVRTVLEGKVCSFDAYQVARGQKYWWVVSLAPITDSDGAVRKYISIAMNITDRKKAEEERVILYEQRLILEKLHRREKEHLLMDLHDGIGGIATNISILASVHEQTDDVASMRKNLIAIRKLANEGIAEVRSFMHSLDVKELNWRSLAAELKYQGSQMVEPHGISFLFNANIAAVAAVPGSLFWVNIFKIYKESLTNVIKHAQADTVRVDLAVREARFELTIHDNGVGWADQSGIGRGFANIRKRIGELGGTVTLSNDRGLLVSLQIPFPVSQPVPA